MNIGCAINPTQRSEIARPINRTFDDDSREGVRTNETRIRAFPTVVTRQKWILTAPFMKNGVVLLVIFPELPKTSDVCLPKTGLEKKFQTICSHATVENTT